MSARPSHLIELREPDARARWLTLSLRGLWAGLRGYLQYLNGDTAYAHYLAHWRVTHHGPQDDFRAPLSRAEFFKRETERRWAGVRRCC